MKGRRPKPPELRQRRNRTTTAAVLTEGGVKAPPLPRMAVTHPKTREWWRQLWRAPMAAQFLDIDKQALYRLAILVNEFWVKPTAMMEAQIEKSEARFGLTPMDRHRLQWKLEEEPPKKPKPQAPMTPVEDPRRALRAVK